MSSNDLVFFVPTETNAAHCVISKKGNYLQIWAKNGDAKEIIAAPNKQPFTDLGQSRWYE